MRDVLVAMKKAHAGEDERVKTCFTTLLKFCGNVVGNPGGKGQLQGWVGVEVGGSGPRCRLSTAGVSALAAAFETRPQGRAGSAASGRDAFHPTAAQLPPLCGSTHASTPWPPHHCATLSA